jgi:hypothetical protein
MMCHIPLLLRARETPAVSEEDNFSCIPPTAEVKFMCIPAPPEELSHEEKSKSSTRNSNADEDDICLSPAQRSHS